MRRFFALAVTLALAAALALPGLALATTGTVAETVTFANPTLSLTCGATLAFGTITYGATGGNSAPQTETCAIGASSNPWSLAETGTDLTGAFTLDHTKYEYLQIATGQAGFTPSGFATWTTMASVSTTLGTGAAFVSAPVVSIGYELQGVPGSNGTGNLTGTISYNLIG